MTEHVNTCATETCRQSSEATRTGLTYTPRVDIVEHADRYALHADVPGATAENIELDLRNGRLHLTARVAPRQTEGQRFVRREFGVGDFSRSFEVGDSIDLAGVQARVSGGVLTIDLPKAAAHRARRVSVTQA